MFLRKSNIYGEVARFPEALGRHLIFICSKSAYLQNGHVMLH